jgi:exopolysaccharide biosynthesis WecB/TagA/CpsF family protein
MQIFSLFGIRYCATDYTEATSLIIAQAMDPGKVETQSPQTSAHGMSVSALAVHGLVEAYNNPVLRQKVNNIDLVLPDGQPIRWALNFFFDAGLKDRVYGPTLTVHLLQQAAEKGLPVFFYGSTPQTIETLTQLLPKKFPGLKLAGMQPDRFRDSTDAEQELDRETIRRSGARIVFVGRGCPRQEHWVADNRNHLDMPLIAVGAAFDFLAGNISQAPAWMQRAGLEWLYRLGKEPGRLWKRYLFTNSQFIALFVRETLKKPFRKTAYK